ncbi:hypothetical protein Nos7524_1182 [Nostoc sp. PCC 7524]|uniref:hypothetical protein n=1 Tax=Nostoc sp. (strain ATCC 29411 / PCC 7524) TaxID=28072 RepID=UPI00029F3E51|nr:hypothetical protein [Nostoc sp. PCC 7524]AFY47073.1 hypothetical protein Nos7524_1182 [Nostoc sp. PCC 7524]
MLTPEIETRLAILETEVARLKQQLPVTPIPWWQNILGTFANDPAYDEAMQLGQQYRQSLRPDSDSYLDI